MLTNETALGPTLNWDAPGGRLPRGVRRLLDTLSLSQRSFLWLYEVQLAGIRRDETRAVLKQHSRDRRPPVVAGAATGLSARANATECPLHDLQQFIVLGRWLEHDP